MPAVLSNNSIMLVHGEALCDPEIEVIIAAAFKRCFKAPDLFENIPPVEHNCRMSDRIALEQSKIEVTFVGRLRWIRYDLSRAIDLPVAPKYKTAIWILLEAIQASLDSIGKQTVVMIQEYDKLSRARVEAGIAGGPYTLVGLIDVDDFRIRARYFRRIIGRTIVYNDDLSPRMRECKRTLNCLAEIMGLIKTRDHNRDQCIVK